MTTTAKIRAKGLSATGMTEDLATKLYHQPGGRIMAIVELKVDETHEKADGDQKVDFVITELEPVVDGQLNGQVDEAVRRIHRALYMNRQLAEGGDAQLDLENDEPTVPEVLAAAAALVETDEAGEVTGLWDGDTEDGDTFTVGTVVPDQDEDTHDATVLDPFTVPR